MEQLDLILNLRGLNIAVQHGEYQVSCCPDSLRRQDVSTHDIDYVE